MQMPKAKRHRQVSTALPQPGTLLRPVLVFPTLSNNLNREIETACRADRRSRTIMTFDEYHLYGELFRRLVQTTDAGYIHVLILKGFLLALQTTTHVRLTIIQEDDKAALLQECCNFALRPISNGYSDPSSSRWVVILLMNKTTCNDFFDAALCFDLSARVFYYLYFDFTTEEAIQEHVVLEERLCARYDVPLSSKQARKGVNVSEADSGIWLCLAMHLCIEGFDMPAWEPSMRLEARLHDGALHLATSSSCPLQRMSRVRIQ